MSKKIASELLKLAKSLISKDSLLNDFDIKQAGEMYLKRDFSNLTQKYENVLKEIKYVESFAEGVSKKDLKEAVYQLMSELLYVSKGLEDWRNNLNKNIIPKLGK